MEFKSASETEFLFSFFNTAKHTLNFQLCRFLGLVQPNSMGLCCKTKFLFILCFLATFGSQGLPNLILNMAPAHCRTLQDFIQA